MKNVLCIVMAGLVLVAASGVTWAAGEGAETTAQPAPTGEVKAVSVGKGLAVFGACVGAGLAVVGGGIAMGRIGGAGQDAIARQPEAAGQMFAPMIITAAMVEGGMLFAIVLALILA